MASRFVRKVRTASGAIAVQIVTREGRQVVDIDHVGSAHTDAELALLLTAARERMVPEGQDALDLGPVTDLWQVEASFRMTKSDLKARPVFHRTRDAIEAHLTIVFAALAISRHLQHASGISIKKIVQTLRPIRSASIDINGEQITLDPDIPDRAQAILDAINGH